MATAGSHILVLASLLGEAISAHVQEVAEALQKRKKLRKCKAKVFAEMKRTSMLKFRSSTFCCVKSCTYSSGQVETYRTLDG